MPSVCVMLAGISNLPKRRLKRRLSWMADAGQGFSLEYKSISIHAVSRDVTTFPHECLYMMVDGKLEDSAPTTPGDGDDSSSSSEDDEGATTDIRFAPSDKGALDAMFNAMSDCQALHPDEEDCNSEDEAYYGEEDEGELSEQGQATLERLEAAFMAGGDNPQTAAQPNGEANIQPPPPEHVAMEQGSEEPMDQEQFDDADS